MNQAIGERESNRTSLIDTIDITISLYPPLPFLRFWRSESGKYYIIFDSYIMNQAIRERETNRTLLIDTVDITISWYPPLPLLIFWWNEEKNNIIFSNFASSESQKRQRWIQTNSDINSIY